MRIALKFVALAAAALLATGCNVIRGNETTSDYADDAALTARVKAALLDDEAVKGTQFNVDVYKGNVTLSGMAQDATEAKRAEQIARQTPGVKSVDSAIRVSDAGTASSKQ
jgi:hyperosmotically inducible periplasmic protein